MMLPVNERRATPRRSLRRAAAALTPLLLVATACGGSGDETHVAVAASVAPSTTPTTRVPATTAAPTTTTTAPTTTAAPTSTAAPTTTTTSTLPTIGTTTVFPTSTTVRERESEPITPPVDAYASEPVIEMGTISIPKIGVSMTMYEGIRMTTLDLGPGHWPGTALPGQAGNVVVGGHRTSKHKVFRHVERLVAGDEIIFEDDNGRHVYRVDRVEIVEPTAVWIVNPTETPTATLFACHPPGSTAQRIVVFADLVTS
jgi:sortase A